MTVTLIGLVLPAPERLWLVQLVWLGSILFLSTFLLILHVKDFGALLITMVVLIQCLWVGMVNLPLAILFSTLFSCLANLLN